MSLFYVSFKCDFLSPKETCDSQEIKGLKFTFAIFVKTVVILVLTSYDLLKVLKLRSSGLKPLKMKERHPSGWRLSSKRAIT